MYVQTIDQTAISSPVSTSALHECQSSKELALPRTLKQLQYADQMVFFSYNFELCGLAAKRDIDQANGC